MSSPQPDRDALPCADATGVGRMSMVDRGLAALDDLDGDPRYADAIWPLSLMDVRKELLLLGIDACEAMDDPRRAADLSMPLLRATGWSDKALVRRALALTALVGDNDAMAEIYRNRPRVGFGSAPESS